MSHSTENNFKKEIVVSRGLIEPDSRRSYKGVLFRNTFKVDRPIILVGLSFCGVHEKHLAETNIPYQISIRVHQSWISRQPTHKLCKRPTMRSRLMKKGEKIRVDFLQQEHIKPNAWYDIEFEINGPDTMHLKLGSLQSQYTLEHEGKTILVMECFIGSCQMSDFHFILP